MQTHGFFPSNQPAVEPILVLSSSKVGLWDDMGPQNTKNDRAGHFQTAAALQDRHQKIPSANWPRSQKMSTTACSSTSFGASQVDFFDLQHRQKREIAVDMLDYGFVEKCHDLELLKGILFTLRSGKEGKYPQLEKFTEDRILTLLPASKRNKILRMRSGPTQQEVCQEIEDLQAWATRIDQTHESLQAHKDAIKKNSQSHGNLPPVRGQQPPSKDANSSVEELAPMRREQERGERPSKAIPAYDFRAWEKFDVDQAIQELDKEELARQQEAQRLAERRAQRAKQRQQELASLPSYVNLDELSQEEREVFALHEKQKGNESFRVGENDEAVLYYSRSLAFDDTNAIVYANRAMTYLRLKQFANAEHDCTRAVQLDPKYVKAWSRRGMARFRRGKYQQAIEDFEQALKLQPDNNEIKQLLAKTKTKWTQVDGTATDQLQKRQRSNNQVQDQHADHDETMPVTSRFEEIRTEENQHEDPTTVDESNQKAFRRFEILEE